MEKQKTLKKAGIYIIQSLIVGSIFPIVLFGQVEFSQILPNTIDDTNLEYIELRNTSCETMDIGGYILEDASTKQYIFPTPSIINSHDILHIDRPTSKIILNNTDETLYLKDPAGNLVDQFSYANSSKGTIIIDITVADENCAPLIDTGSSEGENIDTSGSDQSAYQSGSIDTVSGEISDTGSIDTSIENTETGMIDSGITNTDTDTINDGFLSGDISTGSIQDVVLFPEISSTIQYPTNAVFSGGIFDCSGLDPCRINLTFELIFTGSFLERDYICESIANSGSLVTCNPNTFYFSTGGSITFRLSKKSDPTFSRSVTWEVKYNSTETNLIHSESGSEGNMIETESIFSGVTFPDIIPTFQNYTNTSFSGDILTCSTHPCRLNFTLDSIFTGSYNSRDYTCEILYGTGEYDCNPPQLYLIGTGSIEVRLIHKETQEDITRILQVIPSIPVQVVSSNMTNSIIDTNPPVIILEYDGKMKSYHEQIGDYEINCYTFTCAINLSAEKSYDPEGSPVHYLWYYGFNDIKTTKDPGERKYGLGDHTIWLRVIDVSGNVSSIKYRIHVLGSKEKAEKIEKKIKENTDSNKKSSKKKKGTIKKKVKTMTFFDPPKIVLQKSKFIEKNGSFECYTSTKTCSLNLSISGATKGMTYAWRYSDGETIVSKNPKSQSFAPGIHNVRIVAGYSIDMPLWTQDIQVKVIKIQKPKKIKPPKIVQMSGSIKEDKNLDMPILSALGDTKSQEKSPILLFAFLLGIVPIFILRMVFGVPTVRI